MLTICTFPYIHFDNFDIFLSWQCTCVRDMTTVAVLVFAVPLCVQHQIRTVLRLHLQQLQKIKPGLCLSHGWMVPLFRPSLSPQHSDSPWYVPTGLPRLYCSDPTGKILRMWLGQEFSPFRCRFWISMCFVALCQGPSQIQLRWRGTWWEKCERHRGASSGRGPSCWLETCETEMLFVRQIQKSWRFQISDVRFQISDRSKRVEGLPGSCCIRWPRESKPRQEARWCHRWRWQVFAEKMWNSILITSYLFALHHLSINQAQIDSKTCILFNLV